VSCTFACVTYRESQVRDVIEECADRARLTVAEIYNRLGKGPRCGRCLVDAKDLIIRCREKTPAPAYTNPEA
jgi:bacterioferritin-associated ferredoxin